MFVSHSHTDEAPAARMADALTAHGLRVFRAVGAVDAFTSISDAVMRALRNSRFLLACYSREYPTRQACQHEFATAYLAGHAEGDPLGRVVAVNLEDSVEHIEPRQLRDTLLPTVTSSPASLPPVVRAVAERVAATSGPIGTVTTDRPLRWLVSRPVYPPNSFIGRWTELWWLHSALHPHVGPLTSPPTTPIAVLHGAGGIGKTALAAEYVRRFGAAFPDGIVWLTPGSAATSPEHVEGRRCLWVLDDAVGEPGEVAGLLPADPGVPSLVLTRDARLSKLGNALALTDLNAADSALLIATRGAGQRDPAALTEITSATEGSPELRGKVAELAGSVGAEASLDRLHRLPSDLLRPLESWLVPELRAVGEPGWDVLRVLAAAAPSVVPILRIADILAAVRDSDRVREIVPIQQVVTELLARGVLAAAPDAVELALPSALTLALRQLDDNPHRAERIRAATIRALTRLPESAVHRPRPGPPQHDYGEEAQRAAHLIRTELLNRVTGHPLQDHQGSLRDALQSLHTLLTITRTEQGRVHPAALRSSTSAPGLDTVADRLINDVLRDLLNYWHVELSAHEDLRPPGISRIDHERNWARHDELRQALGTIHRQAIDIANDLHAITGNIPRSE